MADVSARALGRPEVPKSRRLRARGVAVSRETASDGVTLVSSRHTLARGKRAKRVLARPSERDMILRHASTLNGAVSIVLASASPRRREILTKTLGLTNVVVVKSAFAEDLDKSKYDGAAAYAEATAWKKAMDVCQNWSSYSDLPMPDVVISADTVVESASGTVMEKPGDASEARAMLRALSGSTSRVHTGVAIVTPKVRVDRVGELCGKVFSETTRVEFAELEDEEIDAYIATGEPFDKAGGYGIQGPAAAFIRGIVGDYFNVVGFPVHAFTRELEPMVGDILERA